jgi:hypothetical protein
MSSLYRRANLASSKKRIFRVHTHALTAQVREKKKNKKEKSNQHAQKEKNIANRCIHGPMTPGARTDVLQNRFKKERKKNRV